MAGMINTQAALAALQRMNMREQAIAPHFNGVGVDLMRMAQTDPQEGEKHFMEVMRAELCAAYGFGESREQNKPFAFAGGVAIIPVHGTLINRFGQSWGSVTGYNFIRSQINMAIADDDVEAIVLDLNSYGGEAAGCFELAADIRNARSSKPILGVIDSNCYSACYAIGSACSQLVITPSGGAGSVGVVSMHVNMSKFLDSVGFEVTLIASGDHKVDGNPFEALPKSVKADIKAGVDKTRVEFATLVGTNRNMDVDDVLNTEARIYRAEDAVSLGLVDAIATPTEAVQAFLNELSGSKQKGVKKMSTTVTQPGAQTPATPGTEAAAAPAAAAPTVDQAAVASQARADERARVAGIMGCEAAKERQTLANHLALNTDLSVEAAQAILNASPTEQKAGTQAQPAAAANQFKQAMDADKHPEVTPDGAAAKGQGDEEMSLADQVLRAQAQATGAATH